MIEAGVVVGYVVAWAVGKLWRAVDAEVDTVLDSGVGRLHDLVAARLGTDPALRSLHDEAARAGQVSEPVRRQVERSVAQVARDDEGFARAVAELVAGLQAGERAGGQTAVGSGSAAVAGDVNIHAETGAVAAWNIGSVSLGQPPADPRGPGRSGD